MSTPEGKAPCADTPAASLKREVKKTKRIMVRFGKSLPPLQSFDFSHASHAKVTTALAAVVSPTATAAPAPLATPLGLELIVAGQGVVEVVAAPMGSKDSIQIELRMPKDDRAFMVEVKENYVKVSAKSKGKKVKIAEKKGEGIGIETQSVADDAAEITELNPYYSYWVSLDSYNGLIRYGKGEVRKETTLLRCRLEKKGYEWAADVSKVSVDSSNLKALEKTNLWRDPVVAPTPLLIARQDDITMDMAARNEVIPPASLNDECQMLYEHIAGRSFVLDSPDFPDFTKAIEQSIKRENGWCYKKLLEKAGEFGSQDINSTYLRITLGKNQGNSPGVPFVMEIWPGGHHSPIHSHAGANAVIKVLHGAITVELFPFLSVHKTTPFGKRTFRKGEVTWATAQLNQTHRLTNEDKTGPPCITIQCYSYDKKDKMHYESFDYIDNSGTKIGNFLPVSDMDFLKFKKQMKKEWENTEVESDDDED